MEKYFPAHKIVLTGNPIRREVIETEGKRTDAAKFFGLDPVKLTVLVVGGSQGALSVNRCIETILPALAEHQVQMVWQTGQNFRRQAAESCEKAGCSSVKVTDFIQRMDLAYSLADVVISRAGAIAIAELAAVRKPVIFIPLPSAAEDHQMKNAMKLAEQGAAMVIPDKEAPKRLKDTLFGLMGDEAIRKQLAASISQFAITDADKKIADEIIKLIHK
jgi:UDP-N-acetylglucosamine--N-acetylmuramyl-(pentapeptide) pyrophosphoryl-undecaprenol N-acetylglucosamine transferase